MTNATEVMEPVRLPAEIAEELGALQARSERLGRSSRRYLGVASTAVVASGVMGGLAWWLGPDAALKAAHLPNEIANLFSAVVPGSGGSFSSVAGNIESVASSMVGMMKNVAVVIGIGVVGSTLYRFWVAARDEREMPSIAGLIFAPALIFAPWVMSAMFGIGDGGSSQSDGDSPRQTFVAYVEGANYSAVQKALQEIKASDTVTSYMLSQVALAQANKAGKPLEPSGKNALVEQVSRLDEALPKRVSFTVSPQAVYAVEVAALGKPSSSIAVSYLNESQHKAGLARVGQTIAGLLALAAGLVGGGMLLVGRRIRARLDRILPLLGQAPAKPVVGNAGTPKKVAATAEAPKQRPEQDPNWQPAWQRASSQNVQSSSTADDASGLSVSGVLMGAAVVAAAAESVVDAVRDLGTDYPADDSSGAGDIDLGSGGGD